MKKVLTTIAAVLLVTVFVQADGYIKQSTHTDAFQMMGQKQPAVDETTEQWIGDDQMATISKGRTVIVDLKKNAIFIVNNAAKTYVEMTLPLDMSKYLPPQFAQLMGMTKVTVTPNGQTQQIGQWACDGYDMALDMGMMKTNAKIWASKNVGVDWQALADKMMPLLMQASMRLGNEAMQEFAKIKGLQIKSESTMEMMGASVKMGTEVLEISNKPAPAGIYEVPAGYAKQDQFSMQDMR